MDVRASWVPSVSTDVVVQKLSWFINGELFREVNATPADTVRLLSTDGGMLTEGDECELVIVANDGKSDSIPTSASISIPLDPPEPVTELVLELV